MRQEDSVKNSKAINPKYYVNPPKILRNVVKCSNPRCITSIEEGCTQIFVLSASGKYRCLYCNREYLNNKA